MLVVGRGRRLRKEAGRSRGSIHHTSIVLYCMFIGYVRRHKIIRVTNNIICAYKAKVTKTQK